MHAGKLYPYHPNYWATEAWFWRGEVPFKMHGRCFAEPTAGWTLVPLGWEGVSDPGVPSSDSKYIEYEFAIDPPGAFPSLLVRLEKSSLNGEAKAMWRVQLVGSGGVIDTAWRFQAFPQYEVFCSGLTTWTPPAPPSAGQAVPLEFRPATYAEGGTPWPNY